MGKVEDLKMKFLPSPKSSRCLQRAPFPPFEAGRLSGLGGARGVLQREGGPRLGAAGTLRPVTGCSPRPRSAGPRASLSGRPRASLTFDPTLPPSPGSLPKSGRGGCGEAGIQVGFSLRSFLSSPRERRRGPRPEVLSEALSSTASGGNSPRSSSKRRPGRQSPGPGAPAPRAAAGTSPPAPERPLQKRAEEHPRPTDLAGHQSCGEA